MTDPTWRFGLVKFYAPDGTSHVALGELYMNESGEVWSVELVTFAGADESDVVTQLENAIADCLQFPIFDGAGPYAEPPAGLQEDFADAAEQLSHLFPETGTKH